MLGNIKTLYKLHTEKIMQGGHEYSIEMDVVRIITNVDHGERVEYYTDFKRVRVIKKEKRWFISNIALVFERKVEDDEETNTEKELLDAAKEYVRQQAI